MNKKENIYKETHYGKFIALTWRDRTGSFVVEINHELIKGIGLFDDLIELETFRNNMTEVINEWKRRSKLIVDASVPFNRRQPTFDERDTFWQGLNQDD